MKQKRPNHCKHCGHWHKAGHPKGSALAGSKTALDSAIKNNPVMSKSVEKRVLVQIQDIAKSLNLHCKMEDEHEATKEFQKNCMYNTGKKLMSK